MGHGKSGSAYRVGGRFVRRCVAAVLLGIVCCGDSGIGQQADEPKVDTPIVNSTSMDSTDIDATDIDASNVDARPLDEQSIPPEQVAAPQIGFAAIPLRPAVELRGEVIGEEQEPGLVGGAMQLLFRAVRGIGGDAEAGLHIDAVVEVLEEDGLAVGGFEGLPMLGQAEANMAQIAESRNMGTLAIERAVTAELRFLHSLCPLTHSQFTIITAAMEPATDELLNRYVASVSAVNRRHVLRQQIGLHPRACDIVAGVDAAILTAIRDVLPTDVVGHFETEVAARRQFQKRAVIEVLAAKLQRDLSLRVEQRELLLNVLSDNWHDHWVKHVDFMMFSGIDETYYPSNLPFDKIAAMVTDELQRDAIDRLQRMDAESFGEMPSSPFDVFQDFDQLEQDLQFQPELAAP